MNILLFELFTIVLSIIILTFLQLENKNTLKRYYLLIVGVFIFEFFTQPLWHNLNMSWWAYIYQDVSWVLTLGWSSILLFSMSITDKFFKLKESRKFFIYLAVAGIIGIIAESVVVSLGIRSYAPETIATLSGIMIPFTITPIEALYYMPVFMSLIIGFMRYFEIITSPKSKTKKKRRKK